MYDKHVRLSLKHNPKQQNSFSHHEHHINYMSCDGYVGSPPPLPAHMRHNFNFKSIPSLSAESESLPRSRSGTPSPRSALSSRGTSGDVDIAVAVVFVVVERMGSTSGVFSLVGLLTLLVVMIVVMLSPGKELVMGRGLSWYFPWKEQGSTLLAVTDTEIKYVSAHRLVSYKWCDACTVVTYTTLPAVHCTALCSVAYRTVVLYYCPDCTVLLMRCHVLVLLQGTAEYDLLGPDALQYSSFTHRPVTRTESLR